MTPARVCPLCLIDRHMEQPQAHPYWDDGRLLADEEWAVTELCGCSCADEPVHRPFVDVHLPPYEER